MAEVMGGDRSLNWWDDFEWAKYEPGSYYRNLMLYSIGLSMQAKTTVEIGIGQQPNGVYLLGSLAKEIEGSHTSIDVAQTPINRALQIVDKYELPVMVVQFDSKAVAWNRKIDLLYIDGGHDCEQVSGDIKNFSKHVRRNGFMIFDDYGKKHLQVTEAVDEYMNEHGDLWQVLQHPQLWWMICRRL